MVDSTYYRAGRDKEPKLWQETQDAARTPFFRPTDFYNPGGAGVYYGTNGAGKRVGLSVFNTQTPFIQAAKHKWTTTSVVADAPPADLEIVQEGAANHFLISIRSDSVTGPIGKTFDELLGLMVDYSSPPDDGPPITAGKWTKLAAAGGGGGGGGRGGGVLKGVGGGSAPGGGGSTSLGGGAGAPGVGGGGGPSGIVSGGSGSGVSGGGTVLAAALLDNNDASTAYAMFLKRVALSLSSAGTTASYVTGALDAYRITVDDPNTASSIEATIDTVVNSDSVIVIGDRSLALCVTAIQYMLKQLGSLSKADLDGSSWDVDNDAALLSLTYNWIASHLTPRHA